MKKSALFFGLATLALAGCTSYYTERGAQSQVDPYPTLPPGYRTEWNVAEQRTKAEGSARVWFWFFTSGDPKHAEVPGLNMPFFPSDRAIYRAKAAATYNACEQANADALLGVSYKYTVTNYFFTSKVECEVVGFPATITALKFREDQPVLIDKSKEIIRIKPWERLIDCSGTPKVGVVDYRGATANEAPANNSSSDGVSLFHFLFPFIRW